MRFTSLLAFAAVLSLSVSAMAAPEFTGTWVNGEGIKMSSLKGKVAVLYFYEEGCPNCRNKWPGLVAAAESFKDQPVVFIAVNSGNDPKAVEGYLKSVNCSWLGLADVDRAFEKACKVQEVSLRNIYQMRVVTAEGNIVPVDPANTEAAVKPYVAKAAWKVDPKNVPEPMKAAWKAVEFGDYALAAPVVKRSLASKDEKTKAAAEAMQSAITADMEALLAEAGEAAKAARHWEAYKLYMQVADNFKGNPKATEAGATAKKLAADKDLKNEIKAWGILEKAKKMLASRNRQERRSAEDMLKSLAKEFDSTEAGQIAAEMTKVSTPAE